MKILPMLPVVTLVACATSLSAADAPKGQSCCNLNYQRGVISSVDTKAHQFVIKEQQQAAQTFHWTDTTQFAEVRHTVTAADLKPGEKVKVGFVPGTSPLTAQTLEITPAWGSHHRTLKTN